MIVGLLGSLLAVCVLAPAAAAQSAEAGVPSLVEVYWQWSRTITTPGLSNLIVLDPEVARVETTMDGLQVFGLTRGETVLLGYMNDKPVSIRLRVVERPQVVLPPSALRRQSEMAQGSFGSSVQIANTAGQTTYGGRE